MNACCERSQMNTAPLLITTLHSCDDKQAASTTEHDLSISNDPAYVIATITVIFPHLFQGIYDLICGLRNATHLSGTYDAINA
jgi:hypothetical protein